MLSWLILLVAGLFESAWAIGMKYTHGFTRLWPSVFVFASIVVSMFLLSVAVKSLPIGTAYAVWTGIGAVSTALLGILLFHEPATVARIVCMLFIVSGICGLVLLEK